jgi:ribulose-phosphate 3-epimerase
MNIYPSLMVVPEQKLEKEISLLASHCAGFHIDSMDGIFVPTIFWHDAAQVNKIIKLAKQVWIHLMIQKPDVFYDQLELPDDSLVSFHIESDVDVFSFSKIIREKKHRVSLAINPKTPISDIIPFLSVMDHVLVMSVNPGRSGQSFLENSFEKIAALVAYRKMQQQHFSIGVDGGINKNNIHLLAMQDVDDCAIASGIFNDEDHVTVLQELQKLSQ